MCERLRLYEQGRELEFVSARMMIGDAECLLTVQFAPCYPKFTYALAHPNTMDSATLMQDIEQRTVRHAIGIDNEHASDKHNIANKIREKLIKRKGREHRC